MAGAKGRFAKGGPGVDDVGDPAASLLACTGEWDGRTRSWT